MANKLLSTEGRSALRPQQANTAIYGETGGLPDRDRVIASPIDIRKIDPDPTQPRRTLPSQIRYQPDDVGAVLTEWWDMASDEAGFDIDVLAHLMGADTPRTDEDSEREPGKIEMGFMKLLDLASTIRRDGLKNAISVYPVGDRYRIETGERRWLAHNLLARTLEDGDKWARIPAREVKVPSVWAQATENTARDDLNAISMARQLALLLMDLYQTDGHVQFQPYEAFEHDRHFYAQIADGREYPVPYGSGDRIIAAMGVKHRSQINHYRQLLRVPDHLWTMGDDERWGLNSLLELARESMTAVIDSPQANPDPAPDLADAPPSAEGTVQIIPQADDSDPAQQIVDHLNGAGFHVELGGAPAPAAPAAEPGSGAPSWTINHLRQAYKLGQRNLTGWFAAAHIGTNIQLLNDIVSLGYMTCKAPTNTDHRAAVYRITNAGCDELGLARLEFHDSPPRPDPLAQNTGGLFAGAQPQGDVPPSQKPRGAAKLFDTQAERTFKVMSTFTEGQLMSAQTRPHVLATLRRGADLIAAALARAEELGGSE